ncbi:MAG TPA: hypothetical protein PKJ62_06610 [Bacteroidia bacterium]|nr:hypothetical protein [Bacteroidia bacterium]
MKLKISFILLIFSVLTVGCSNYNRVLKGNDMDAKMEAAIRYYNKGDYIRPFHYLKS